MKKPRFLNDPPTTRPLEDAALHVSHYYEHPLMIEHIRTMPPLTDRRWDVISREWWVQRFYQLVDEIDAERMFYMSHPRQPA